MKISYIQESKVAILAFILSFVCIPLFAQDIATILFGKNNKTNYIGQLNYNGKRKNGFGIERQNRGSVYIGDFSENKISGRGMLIAMEKGISNIPNAVVYIGNWRNGKKDGKGVCYNKNGILIYEGHFKNDKPIEEISNEDIPSPKQFCMIEINKSLYLGEVNNNIPNGFGLTIEDNGDIIYGVTKDGIRQGIGMIFYEPDIWEVGKWTDGNFKAFNSSSASENKIREFKNENKEWKKEMRGMLTEAAFNFAQAGITTATIINDVKSTNNTTYDEVSSDDDIPSGKSLSYYQTLYNKWELKAKNAYSDRVHHKINAETLGDGRVASSDAKLLRQYQNSMRSTRLAAKKEGFNIPQSKYETISF